MMKSLVNFALGAWGVVLIIFLAVYIAIAFAIKAAYAIVLIPAFLAGFLMNSMVIFFKIGVFTSQKYWTK